MGDSSLSADLQNICRMRPEDLAAQMLTAVPEGYEWLPADARNHLEVACASIA